MQDFTYKETEYNWREEFPKLGLELFLQQKLKKFNDKNQHQAVANILQELVSGSYNFEWFYENFSGKKFEGTCHQKSPVFSLFLAALGLEAYFLDCYQVSDRMSKDPESPEEKFKELGYNPYCLVEVKFWNDRFLISPKHFNQDLVTLLQPVSHREFIGTMPHPEDPDKSGIYLKNLNKTGREAVWMKKDYKEEKEEYFRCFEKKRIRV